MKSLGKNESMISKMFAETHHLGSPREPLDLRTMIDAIPALIVGARPDGSIEFVNRGWWEYTGSSLEQLEGRGWQAVIHRDDLSKFIDKWHVARAAGKPFEAEARVRRADGQYHWFLIRKVPLRDQTDEIVRWYGTGFDIEDRKQAEERLRHANVALREETDKTSMFEEMKKSEAHFKRIIDTIPTIVWRSTPDGSVEFLNQRWHDYTGVSPEEAHGSGWMVAHHPKDLVRVNEKWRACLSTGEPGAVEGRLRRFDGEYRWFLLLAEPLRDEAGNIVNWYGADIDIEDRKRSEQVLRESEERFRLVANTAPVMIWMSGPDKLCNYFNQPWLEFTGRPIESELGNGWAQGVHPEDSRGCVEAYTNAFDRRESFRMEYRLRRHDGQYRWVSDIGVPRLNADGSFAGYIGSCIDVTDRKLAEEALAGVSRKLIEAQEQERNRIGRELHDDIGQRLAMLAIGLEQLQQSPPHLSEVPGRMGELQKQTSEIADDIQTLSHELHSAKLQYLGIAAAMRGFCQEFGEQQKAEIDFQTHDLPSPVPPDTALCFFRVLQEALHNSAKHSGVRHFEVRLWGTSDALHLTVRDSGIGFDSEAAQTNRGLGLISMEERLKLLNGTFSIESQSKRGTTIHARVPLGSENDSVRAAG